MLDSSDAIRINRRTYTLAEVENLHSDVPEGRESWEFLRRELGVSALSGVNLQRAHLVFGLREQARFLLSRPNQTSEQQRIGRGFLEESNRLGLPTLDEGNLLSLASFAPPSGMGGPYWEASECLLQSGWVFCTAQRATRQAQDSNRRMHVVVP